MINDVNFVFDTETNGLGNCSVLSISFIICSESKVINEQTRYYYANEPYNYHATKVHGLTKDVIEDKRNNCDYPKYFKDDHDWLIDIIDEFEVDNFIAHNINFDKKFLPEIIKEKIESKIYSIFCTMRENSKYVGIKKGKGYKSPKLSEACKAYGLEFSEDKAHASDYDTLKAYELFDATIKNRLEGKIMNLRDKENEILKEWKELILENKYFSKDGAGKNYQDSKVKILFLAKETNGTAENWDTREYLDNGVFYKTDQYAESKNGKYLRDELTGEYKKSKNGNYRKEHTGGKPIGKTFNNIYRWANYFLNDVMSLEEYSKVPKGGRKNIFSKIAMMNLKKTPGKASTNTDELKEAIKKYKENIKKQLDLYTHSKDGDINIIICCGKGVLSGLKTVIGNKNLHSINEKNGKFITAKYENTIVMDFYQPQVRGVSGKVMYELLEDNKEILTILQKKEKHV